MKQTVKLSNCKHPKYCLVIIPYYSSLFFTCFSLCMYNYLSSRFIRIILLHNSIVLTKVFDKEESYGCKCKSSCAGLFPLSYGFRSRLVQSFLHIWKTVNFGRLRLYSVCNFGNFIRNNILIFVVLIVTYILIEV